MCPTCSHTMAKVANDEPIFHCQRCGTVKTDGGVFVPSLVHRVRAAREADAIAVNVLYGYALTEAILPEGER